MITRVDAPAQHYRNVTKEAGRSNVFDEPLGIEVEVELPNGLKLIYLSSTSVGCSSSSAP
jgi:hypothetical protein